MISYQWTSACAGLSIAGTIAYLVNRDHLHVRHAPWWLFVAMLVGILGVFPRLIDSLATALGISYPPTFLFLMSIGMLLIKNLTTDIQQSRLERELRRLTQHLALVEAEFERRDGSPTGGNPGVAS
jgi:hypothetical protein